MAHDKKTSEVANARTARVLMSGVPSNAGPACSNARRVLLFECTGFRVSPEPEKGECYASA